MTKCGCENEKKSYASLYTVWFTELYNDEQKRIRPSGVKEVL